MKRYFVIICCAFLWFLIPVTLFAQKQGGFMKTYKGGKNSKGISVVINPDSSYVFCSVVGITDDVWLVKLNAKGDTVWSKSLGSGNIYDSTTPYIMIRDSNGNYLMTGQLKDSLNYLHTILLKTDSNGNMLWLKTYDGEAGGALLQTKGGYIIGAYGWRNGSYDFYVIQTDSNGDTLWSKYYGTSNYENGALVHQLLDGGYSLWGIQELNNNNLITYIYVIRINAKGDTLWTKVDYNHQTTGFMSSCYTLDGGYILGGGAYRNQTLMKFDSLGNIQWEKSCCGRDTFDITRSIMQDTNGNLIACGYTFDRANKEKLNGFLFKTDSLGNPLWVRTYGWKTTDEVVFQSKQTLDGGYIMIGLTQGGTPVPTSKALLIKTDSLGCVYYPGAFFTADTQQIKEGDTIHFTDASQVLLDTAAAYQDSVVAWQWYFGDGDTSTLQSPLHQYQDSGSYTVKLVVTNISGCSDSVVKKGYIRVVKPVGVEEFTNDDLRFTIYPNPSEGTLNIAYQLKETDKGKIVFYDMLGRKMTELILNSKTNSMSIHNTFQSGIYTCQFVVNERILANNKLVIIR